VRSPIFLLTASLLNTGSGTTTPPSKSVPSSSAVQSAFQTLQTDLNNDVKVGARPSHASVGQLQDDLLAIRKGTLTGGAATSAIQADEAAILTSLGLSTSQLSQIQSDLQSVQSAIQSASGSGDASTTTATGGATGTTGGSTSTPSGTDPSGTDPSASISGSPAPMSAVQSALQTLQSDLKSDLSAGAQPTHVSVGQLQDDLDALRKGTLTGSQAVTTIKSDAAVVFSSVGLSQDQINQIQSNQAALASAILAQSGQTAGSSASSTGSSASPTSLAAVAATTQSVQPYLIGVPGVGGQWIGRLGGPGIVGFGGQGMGGFGPHFGGGR
jgi:RND superfamily putative drug exporter